jgi:hypothetical protein
VGVHGRASGEPTSTPDTHKGRPYWLINLLHVSVGLTDEGLLLE